MLLAGRHRHRRTESRLEQPLARVYSVANRELGGLSAVALELGKRLVDPRVHQQTLVNRDEPSTFAVDKAQRALRPHSETGVVAVATGLRRCHNCGHRGIGYTRGPFHGLLNHPPLDLQLVLVADVLPLAARALPEIGTGSFGSL